MSYIILLLVFIYTIYSTVLYIILFIFWLTFFYPLSDTVSNLHAGPDADNRKEEHKIDCFFFN